MKDQLNIIIDKINFTINSINVQGNLYHFNRAHSKIALLIKNPPQDEIRAFTHLLNETASICKTYENELWKDKPNKTFVVNMMEDIINRKEFISGLISRFNS